MPIIISLFTLKLKPTDRAYVSDVILHNSDCDMHAVKKMFLFIIEHLVSLQCMAFTTHSQLFFFCMFQHRKNKQTKKNTYIQI